MLFLGYPPYLMTILGAWKVLGSIALLVPRLAVRSEFFSAATMS